MNRLVQLLCPSLIFLDVNADDKEKALQYLAQQMVEQQFAKTSYPQAILEREKMFPTGLQTQICGVAVPHTDPVHVKLEAVSFARVSTDVHFQMMGMNEQQVPVQLIFMLALKEPHGHLDMLQELTRVWQNEECLRALLRATTPQEVLQILQAQADEEG